MKIIAKLLLSAVTLIVLQPAQAQKIDREKLGYFNYLQPPATDQLAESRYYMMKVELGDQDAYRRQLAEQNFDGNTFVMATTEDEPDFTIEIREGAYSYGTPEKKSYDNKGETMYYYQGDVRYHFTIEVTNGAGEEIFRDDVRGSEKMRGDASGSLSVANDYYVKKKTQVKQDILIQQIKELEERFHDQFSNVTKTVHLNYVVIKEKKFEYPGFNDAAGSLQRLYDIFKATPEGTEESEEILNSTIGFLEEFVTDITPEDEKSRKNADVSAAAFYDLGIAYFFAGEYDKARIALEKAASYDEKIMYDVKHMTGICADMAARTGLKFYN